MEAGRKQRTRLLVHNSVFVVLLLAAVVAAIAVIKVNRGPNG